LKRSLLALVGLGLSGALFLGMACGGDDDEEAAAPAATETAAPSGDEADVEAAAQAVAEAYNSGDVETFLAAVSDDFPANVFGAFGAFTKEDVRQAATSGDFSIGDPPFEEFQVSNVTASGDAATADDSHLEGRALINERLSFVRVGESWLLDDINPTRVEAPEGAAEANVGLVEFAFNLDRLSFPAGDVTFQASDDGQQMHEMGIVKLPEGVTLQQALEAEDPEGTLGVTDVAFFAPIDPGDQATWTVTDLEPGHYAYACFIPDQNDPEGTPHALKGMVGEFTVQ
jgi:uncharacterized cupredoxin-like copper-binding protein/ketosteroid isomerase-like protein